MPNNEMKALTIGSTTYNIVDETSGYAKLVSPTFTGTPTAPTPTSGDDSTKIATTAFVQAAMSGAGAGTVTNVGVANATDGGLSISGSPITGAGTITVGHSNVLSSAQTTSAVYPIKIDKNGHISEYGSAVTIPNTYYLKIEKADSTALNWNQAFTTRLNLKEGNNITISKSDSTLTFSAIVPTKVSDLTNDSGFITGYTETDPVFSASAAAGISTSDITNWNGKSDTDEKVKRTSYTNTNPLYPILHTDKTGTSAAYTSDGIRFNQVYNTSGASRWLELGNTTSYTTSGGAYGFIRLYGTGATYYGDLNPGTIGTNSLTANRTWTLPNKTGVIALTSDLPTDEFFINGDIDSGSQSLGGEMYLLGSNGIVTTVEGQGDSTTYISHATSAGYKHIPSGGSSGQVLGYGGSSGTASWVTLSSGGTQVQIVRW